MKLIKNIKNVLADNSGLSLIELIIAAALITIVGAGFCTAAAAAHINTVQNDNSVKSRTAVVSYIDQTALRPIVTAAKAATHRSIYGSSLDVNLGKSTADINDYMDASAHGGKKIDYIGWANVQLYNGSSAISGTKMKCAICKPIDTQTTGSSDINRMYFGFEVPNDVDPE
jgi:Tfp pilus assembly protein PilV